ncbi:MAG: hypothetical protein NT154_24370 [Verrucomicrobia bacterium]|nr:hypothetical protein [Verrucomicrobiota bacterium]
MSRTDGLEELEAIKRIKEQWRAAGLLDDEPWAGAWWSTGIKGQDAMNAWFIGRTEARVAGSGYFGAGFLATKGQWADWYVYEDYTMGTVGSMMDNSLQEAGGLMSTSSSDDSYNDWCREFSQAMYQFHADQGIKLAQSTGGESGWVTPSASKPYTTDRPANRWQHLNAAMDAYEKEKNLPGARAGEVFKSEYEKQAYESILQSLNAENDQRALQLEEQNVQAAQLQGQVQDLDERIAAKTAALEELKRALEDLKNRAAQAGAYADQAGTQNQQLRQQMDQLNASIAAEEASLQAMKSQQHSASSGLSTLVSGLSLVGSLSSASSSRSGSAAAGRNQVMSDTTRYAASGTGANARTGQAANDWDAYAKAHNARISAYVNSRMQGRTSSADSQGKIVQYRQGLGN